jgi:hypothetical protein
MELFSHDVTLAASSGGNKDYRESGHPWRKRGMEVLMDEN